MPRCFRNRNSVRGTLLENKFKLILVKQRDFTHERCAALHRHGRVSPFQISYWKRGRVRLLFAVESDSDEARISLRNEHGRIEARRILVVLVKHLDRGAERRKRNHAADDRSNLRDHTASKLDQGIRSWHRGQRVLPGRRRGSTSSACEQAAQDLSYLRDRTGSLLSRGIQESGTRSARRRDAICRRRGCTSAACSSLIGCYPSSLDVIDGLRGIEVTGKNSLRCRKTLVLWRKHD